MYDVVHLNLYDVKQKKEKNVLKTKRLAHEIRTLYNAIRRMIENSPIKRQIDDVTGTNARILGYLADRTDRDVYQRDIEKEFGITRSTASKVLILMEKKGLIERVGVPHDARLKKIVMTEKSLELAKLMCRDRLETDKILTKGFTDAELKQFMEYITRVKNNIASAERS